MVATSATIDEVQPGANAPESLALRQQILIVLGAMLGLSCGWGPVFLGVTPVFLKPMAESFNWSRADISFLPILGMIGIALGASLISPIAARLGWSRVIAYSIMLLSLGMLAIAVAPANLAYIICIGLLIGIVGAATSLPGYIAIISLAFPRRLGIALGFTMMGSGVGAMFMPIIAGRLLEVMGWREACACFCGICLLLGFIAHQLIFRALDPGQGPLMAGNDKPVREAGDIDQSAEGVSLAQAFRDYRLWLFCLVSILVNGAFTGPVVHLAAYASDRGFSPGVAAQFIGWLGLGATLARLGAGFFMDRIFAPLVACGAYLFGAAGLYLLTADNPHSGWTLIVASLLIGLAAGAAGVCGPFFVRKYFGVRAFGSIYGVLFSSSLLAGALGTYLYGLSFDLLKSYTSVLESSAVVCFSCSVAILLVGRYRY